MGNWVSAPAVDCRDRPHENHATAGNCRLSQVLGREPSLSGLNYQQTSGQSPAALLGTEYGGPLRGQSRLQPLCTTTVCLLYPDTLLHGNLYVRLVTTNANTCRPMLGSNFA